MRYRQIYRGIDLVFYGRSGELEYDLTVARGARPDAVNFQVGSSERLEIDPFGGLAIVTPDGVLRQHAPFAYQDGPEGRTTVACRFRRTGRRSFGFELGAYDPSRVLVIDPVLVYSSAFGSSTVSNFPNVGNAIAVDSLGNSYIAGTTSDNSFVTTPGAFSATGGQGFVTKLNPAGDVVQYSTYFATGINGIAVDAQGSAYIAGEAVYALPQAGHPIAACGQPSSSFVAKLSPGGDSLIYATCISKSVLPEDSAAAIAVDAAGSAYITGSTSLTNFPNGGEPAPQKASGGYSAYVVKLTPDGSAVVYSTLFGGSGSEGGSAIAVDSSGQAYITGTTTNSPDLPVQNALQTMPGGSPVFRSVDNAQTFAKAGSGLLPVGPALLVVDPVNQDVVYAAGKNGKDLFKTTNGGVSWSLVTVPDTSVVEAIAIDPSNTSRIYLGTGQGFYRSTDNGATWASIAVDQTPGVSAIVINPQTPSNLFAVSSPGRVFASTDFGSTWALSFNHANGGLQGLAIDPLNPLNIYATSGYTGVYKSSDGGHSWSQTPIFPYAASQPLVDAANSTVYILEGNNQVNWSSDGGATWKKFTTSSSVSGFALGQDNTGARTIYVAGSGLSIYQNGTAISTDIHNGFVAGRVQAVATAPTNRSTVYVSMPLGSDAFAAKLDPTGTHWVYATYLGGSSDEGGKAIAADKNGNAYVAGWTSSQDFPITPDAAQRTWGGGNPDYSRSGLFTISNADAFVTKISPAGDQLVYSTYFGGSWNEGADAIAVDSSGNAVIAGLVEPYITSPGFPATADAFQTTGSGGVYAFLANLNAAGSQFSYATLLGGGSDYATALALDSAGNAFLTGEAGTSFPTTANVPTSGSVMFAEFQFASSPRPAVAPGGVVDVFNSQPQRSTPGSIVSIYGSNLAASAVSDSLVPLPATLGGTSVTINGIAAPSFYVSPTQINAQVPFEIQPGVAIGLITDGNGASVPFAIDVVADAPSILVDTDTNHLICFNQNGSLNSPQNPAPPGSIVTLYLTGIGLVMNQPATGSPATGLSPAIATATATLGRFPAVIQYLGLTPGSIGLAQANIVMPSVPASDYPLILTLGGAAANWTIISVGGTL